MRSMNNDHDEDDDLSSPIPMEDIERIQRFTEQEMSRCDTILQSESSTESEREQAQKEKQLYEEDIEAINIERMESSDASDSVWIPSTNFWTTLTTTSCDYFRRFRWKSGLGIAITLYLIATFAFSWMSIDDEETAFDDGIQSMVSRQLLSSAAGDAGMITFLIIRSFTMHQNMRHIILWGQDLPRSFAGPQRSCSDAITELLANNVQYSANARPPKPIEESFWKDQNGQSIRICKLDADFEAVRGRLKIEWVRDVHFRDPTDARALSAVTLKPLPAHASPPLVRVKGWNTTTIIMIVVAVITGCLLC